MMKLGRLAVLLLLAFVAALPGRAFAQGVAAEDRSAIRGVIERQISAFRSEDGATAFAFASPSIQGMFGTPENFMRMVKTGYQPVYRAREIEFRELVMVDGQPVQQVLLVGPDRIPVLALYAMERQADGSWRINGCVLTQTSEKTA